MFSRTLDSKQPWKTKVLSSPGAKGRFVESFEKLKGVPMEYRVNIPTAHDKKSGIPKFRVTFLMQVMASCDSFSSSGTWCLEN
jgi:hypothetical protein